MGVRLSDRQVCLLVVRRDVVAMCCACACLANCILCRLVGSCGVECVDKARRCLIGHLCSGMQFIGLLFCIVGCSGLSDNADIVKTTNWASYEMFDNNNAYMNLVATGWTGVATRWTDLNGDHAIKSCSDASLDFHFTMITTSVTKLAGFILAMQRGGLWGSDSVIAKFQSLLVTLLGSITAAMVLISFKDNCYDRVTPSFAPSLGPGYALVGVAAILDILSLLLFAACPAPPPPRIEVAPDETADDIDDEDEKPVRCSSLYT